MKTELKRNKVFELLGVKPTNPRWSWCALSPDHRRAVFTLWEDEMIDGRSQLSGDDYDVAKRLGEADQKKILELVIAEKIPAFGLVCMADNPAAVPRSIKAVKGDYLIRLEIEKDGKVIYGRHREPVYVLEIALEIRKLKESSNDGLQDLEASPLGNEFPDRAFASSWIVIRDAKVRAFVLLKAEGHCEYCRSIGCKSLGFLMSNGKHYLEAHHVIALSDQGKDTIENVIALCPEHHRQAHFGVEAESLESAFIECIQKRHWKPGPQT